MGFGGMNIGGRKPIEIYLNDLLINSVNYFVWDAIPVPDGPEVETSMSSAKQRRWDLPFVKALEPSMPVKDAASGNSLTTALRLIGSFDDLESDAPPTRKSPAQDWSKVIDRIHDVANRAREVEAQSQQQDLRVQQLLDRAREDVKAAAERVQAADARVAEMQARSEALLKAAEERVKAAEERARIAEEWLTQIYETIASEFTVKQDTKQVA